jgi:glycosylphosphatidylinositol transamidase (GPIT) subunit GPI8
MPTCLSQSASMNQHGAERSMKIKLCKEQFTDREDLLSRGQRIAEHRRVKEVIL